MAWKMFGNNKAINISSPFNKGHPSCWRPFPGNTSRMNLYDTVLCIMLDICNMVAIGCILISLRFTLTHKKHNTHTKTQLNTYINYWHCLNRLVALLSFPEKNHYFNWRDTLINIRVTHNTRMHIQLHTNRWYHTTYNYSNDTVNSV